MKAMNKHLKKAIKYVEEHLLERVYVEKIRLSLRCVDEMRCPIDNDITYAIGELMDEYGSDNDLPEEWYESADDFVDFEDIFWKLDIDYYAD